MSEHLEMKVCVFRKVGRYTFFQVVTTVLEGGWLSWPSWQGSGGRTLKAVLSRVFQGRLQTCFLKLLLFSESGLLLSLRVPPLRFGLHRSQGLLSPHPHGLPGFCLALPSYQSHPVSANAFNLVSQDGAKCLRRLFLHWEKEKKRWGKTHSACWPCHLPSVLRCPWLRHAFFCHRLRVGAPLPWMNFSSLWVLLCASFWPQLQHHLFRRASPTSWQIQIFPVELFQMHPHLEVLPEALGACSPFPWSRSEPGNLSGRPRSAPRAQSSLIRCELAPCWFAVSPGGSRSSVLHLFPGLLHRGHRGLSSTEEMWAL